MNLKLFNVKNSIVNSKILVFKYALILFGAYAQAITVFESLPNYYLQRKGLQSGNKNKYV